MRNENINWDTDMVHSARPCRALWAVTFHIWAALLTSSLDTPMHHGKAVGEVWSEQSFMCLKTWQQLRPFPLRTTHLIDTTTPAGVGRVFLPGPDYIFCLLTCRCGKEGCRGEENSHSSSFRQILHEMGKGVSCCRLFSFFRPCTFYFKAWLAGTCLV